MNKHQHNTVFVFQDGISFERKYACRKYACRKHDCDFSLKTFLDVFKEMPCFLYYL